MFTFNNGTSLNKLRYWLGPYSNMIECFLLLLEDLLLLSVDNLLEHVWSNVDKSSINISAPFRFVSKIFVFDLLGLFLQVVVPFG